MLVAGLDLDTELVEVVLSAPISAFTRPSSAPPTLSTRPPTSGATSILRCTPSTVLLLPALLVCPLLFGFLQVLQLVRVMLPSG